MRIVKLNATESTNDYLRDLSRTERLENFTVVTAESQTQGKGQRGSEWISETGKNLTFSILINDTAHFQHGIFGLNVAVATAIFDTYSKLKIPELSVKWPNDIMSGDKKIGGILIENTISSNGNFSSIIGIGLNINQIGFSELPSASSLKLITRISFDRSELLYELLSQLKTNLSVPAAQDDIWRTYRDNLFRNNIESKFELPDGKIVMGYIRDVDSNGRLLVEHSGNLHPYSLKQIRHIY